jgi:hypothetical protein
VVTTATFTDNYGSTTSNTATWSPPMQPVYEFIALNGLDLYDSLDPVAAYGYAYVGVAYYTYIDSFGACNVPVYRFLYLTYPAGVATWHNGVGAGSAPYPLGWFPAEGLGFGCSGQEISGTYLLGFYYNAAEGDSYAALEMANGGGLPLDPNVAIWNGLNGFAFYWNVGVYVP